MVANVDVAVFGAGVVGCAVAERLTRTPGRHVVVIERHAGPGLEASQSNSGVIHTGLHLAPTSRKARLARRGAPMALAWCVRHGIAYDSCGMHVVVASGDLAHLAGELRGFIALVHRARRQGIPIRMRMPNGVRQREPAIRCAFGIWIPDAAIIDARGYVASLAAAAAMRSAEFRFGETVIGCRIDGRCTIVTTTAREFRARAVVNAAGIGATTIAAAAGFPEHRVILYRGEYYEVTNPELRATVRGLVYPVYRLGSPGLGIHLTPTTDGRLLVGPNARRIERPEDIDTDRTPPEVFADAVRPFFPALHADDLRFAYAGIRTKRNDGTPEPDFYVGLDRTDPPFVSCVGIESPGLTAAPSIAEEVDALLAPALAT